MVNGSDCLQILGRAGLQLIKGRIQEYVVSCGMITHHFNMFGIVKKLCENKKSHLDFPRHVRKCTFKPRASNVSSR